MKKLVLFMVMLAAALGSGIASADRIYIPMAYHSGSSDYNEITITNLGTESARVSVEFLAGTLEVKSSAMSTNTAPSSTSTTRIVQGGYTWVVQTRETNLFGTTTSQKRAQVTVQSSASDDPFIAPVRGGGIFIHVASSTGAPTGFIFPTAYRVRTWTSTATAANNGGAVDVWKQ